MNYCGYGVTFWRAEYGDACMHTASWQLPLLQTKPLQPERCRYLVTTVKDLETDLLYKAEVPSKDLLHHNLPYTHTHTYIYTHM